MIMTKVADPLTTGALVLAICAISSSGPLLLYASASALAVVFWRNALAVGVLTPAVLGRRWAEVRALDRRTLWWCAAAGVPLAVHFGTWAPSVKLTSVATSVALVATQPVWQGLIAKLQGRPLRTATWVGIGVAVLGAVLATGADVTTSGRAVVGDLLALAGGVTGAVYTAIGERARVTTSTTVYTTLCYAVCALVLGAVCLVGGVRLTGFGATTWLAIVAVTVGPQLLGHSMFSYALRRVSATTVSVLFLLEVPGAGLIAWAWLGQAPRLSALPGLVLLVIGVLVVVLAGVRGAVPSADPAVP
jgi:drug/metabolite transporter (DMT)-like permease